ncbi:unnamed protein product, partial [Musa textilis]
GSKIVNSSDCKCFLQAPLCGYKTHSSISSVSNFRCSAVGSRLLCA